MKSKKRKPSEQGKPELSPSPAVSGYASVSLLEAKHKRELELFYAADARGEYLVALEHGNRADDLYKTIAAERRKARQRHNMGDEPPLTAKQN